MTPDALASQVRQASEAAQQQGRRELSNAVQRVDAAGAELERLAERPRTGREQVRQVAIMTGVGAVASVIVWVCFSGPIARSLPVSWAVPERMAAGAHDRWAASSQIMGTVDPASWSDLVAASRLWHGNAVALAPWRRAERPPSEPAGRGDSLLPSSRRHSTRPRLLGR